MFYYVFLWCLRSIYVMFYDVINDVHVIYMRCSIMYLVIFYSVFNYVHLVYMWCSKYILGCLKSILVMFFEFCLDYVFLFFLLSFALDFIIFLFMLCIYLFKYYNDNFMKLKLEYYSSKSRTFFYEDRTLFSELRTSSLLNKKIFYLYKINAR
jgi:hypothetical protein